jgi:hypothetical protein
MLRAGLAAALVATLALALTTAIAGTPDGQGAQKSSLGPASGDPSNCQSSSGSNGWAILNSPGRVGAVKFTNGEVHLVGGGANQTYDIYLGNGSTCMMTMSVLTTNGRGIGNGHINVTPGLQGSGNYVALFQGSDERFASGPVNLK